MRSARSAPPGIFEQADWQMATGERAALEGVLSQLKPACAIELGTFRGGSLGCIAAHSGIVHSFDLTLQVDAESYPNVSFHTGDSHVLLPELLHELERTGTSVAFALIDGDHSPDGVRRDLLDLLRSPAMGTGAIVMHDTGNAAVRRGLERVPFVEFSKVAAVDLDFVPTADTTSGLHEGWGGLGVVLLDAARHGPGAAPAIATRRRRNDLWALPRELKRRLRRRVGILLRRFGLHPASRRPQRTFRRMCRAALEVCRADPDYLDVADCREVLRLLDERASRSRFRAAP